MKQAESAEYPFAGHLDFINNNVGRVMQVSGCEPIAAFTVDEDSFSPRLLRAYYFAEGKDFPKNSRLRERIVYDYELEFITFSEGSMVIGNRDYKVAKGDILFRRPGEYTQGIMPYVCYYIGFDLQGNTAKDLNTYNFHDPQDYQPLYQNHILDKIPTHFHTNEYEKYLFLFEKVFHERVHPSTCSKLIIKATILQILSELYADSAASKMEDRLFSSPYKTVLAKVLSYIDENYTRRILLRDLAAIAKLSPSHFHKVFTATTGNTPNDYILSKRLEHAKNLLSKQREGITEVALQSGFDSAAYFSYSFKKHIGISPRNFRELFCYTQ